MNTAEANRFVVVQGRFCSPVGSFVLVFAAIYDLLDLALEPQGQEWRRRFGEIAKSAPKLARWGSLGGIFDHKVAPKVAEDAQKRARGTARRAKTMLWPGFSVTKSGKV